MAVAQRAGGLVFGLLNFVVLKFYESVWIPHLMAHGPCDSSHICRPGYSSAHSLLGSSGILRKVFEGLPLYLRNIELNPLCICIVDDLPLMCCAEFCYMCPTSLHMYSYSQWT